VARVGNVVSARLVNRENVSLGRRRQFGFMSWFGWFSRRLDYFVITSAARCAPSAISDPGCWARKYARWDSR
jgi:hypothetical protein